MVKRKMREHRGRSRNPMRAGVLALALAMAMIAGAPAGATTVSGATGLIFVPTADTLPVGDVEIGVRYIDEKIASSVTYGIFDQIEIGINSVHGNKDSSELGFVLKGTVFTETQDRPALAVGLETDQSYIVASKRLTPSIRAHVGYGIGDMEGLLAGVSLVVNTTTSGRFSPATSILAEMTPKGLNAGLRLVFSPLISVDLALLDLSDFAAGVAIRTRF